MSAFESRGIIHGGHSRISDYRLELQIIPPVCGTRLSVFGFAAIFRSSVVKVLRFFLFSRLEIRVVIEQALLNINLMYYGII